MAYSTIGKVGINDNIPVEEEGVPRSNMKLGDWMRMIKIFFHPEMKERFYMIGKNTNKEELNDGKWSNQDFYIDCSRMYKTRGDELIDELQYNHPEFMTFDPDSSDFTFKGPKGLKFNHKELKRAHLKKFIKWKKSGENRQMESFLGDDAK
eukprot:CAMPEP_0113543704 /NCGR_PEP_ID=MMETSP0015_2-20120614/10302_1 /TAXON_ID=2838 /ORGANISM="Odontella" /LENGTH=150 /DNA_ID=CAMNT_0000443885 /DNA_START=652 /DNA_END=1104 /DNA_ORIENTATION=- /assembly_acc=CAM_ASM_000160